MPLKSTFKTTAWDAANHLETPERIAGYLTAVLEDNDPGLLAAALGDIARSKGMATIAQTTGLNREGLYKTLSNAGNPELSTILKVVDALGLKLQMAAKPKKRSSERIQAAVCTTAAEAAKKPRPITNKKTAAA